MTNSQEKSTIINSLSEEINKQSSLDNIVQNLGLHKIEKHLFLCADQTKPKCCSKKDSLKSWNYLKNRLKELGLDNPNSQIKPYTFRTKANCLRVCQDGPILLVYPDNIWYKNVTPEVLERIIQEHLLNNKIVEEYVIPVKS